MLSRILKGKKKALLDKEESKWSKVELYGFLKVERMLIFFYKHASHKRNMNINGEISKPNGSRVKYFKETTKVGKQHFKILFRYLGQPTLVKL